jgi:Skp family chaperone for outer membrane proteins
MKKLLRGTLGVAAMTSLAISLLVGCNTPSTPGSSGSPGGGTVSAASTAAGAKGVGSIEQEQIFELPEFKDARKKIDDMVAKEKADLDKKFPHPQAPSEEAAKAVREVQLRIQQESAKLVNPLKARAEAAISKVAREKGMLVILDQHIVVFGVPDITEDVKKVFESKDELKLPDELDTSKSPIGYFDQDVVRQLKLFQEVELSVQNKKVELGKGYQKRLDANPHMPPSERELMEKEFKLKVEAYQQQVMEPLIQKVTDSVKEVAQAENLSLVLDKQHVMQGGRNMTNEVVEAFLKRAGTPVGKPKASGSPVANSGAATPKASATPGTP